MANSMYRKPDECIFVWSTRSGWNGSKYFITSPRVRPFAVTFYFQFTNWNLLTFIFEQKKQLLKLKAQLPVDGCYYFPLRNYINLLVMFCTTYYRLSYDIHYNTTWKNIYKLKILLFSFNFSDFGCGTSSIFGLLEMNRGDGQNRYLRKHFLYLKSTGGFVRAESYHSSYSFLSRYS